jgi:putative ABC transport system substrate-binding protein
LGVDLLSIKLRDEDDLTTALASLRKWRADSLLVLDVSVNFKNRKLLAEFAAKNSWPMMAGPIALTEAGRLISYGANHEDLSRRAATLVDKILRGANPAEIPVEQATKFESIVNLKTAKVLGIKIPQSVLVRADRAIE